MNCCEPCDVPKSSGVTDWIHFPVSPPTPWKLCPVTFPQRESGHYKHQTWDPSGMNKCLTFQSNLTYLNKVPQGQAWEVANGWWSPGQFSPCWLLWIDRGLEKQLKDPYLSVWCLWWGIGGGGRDCISLSRTPVSVVGGQMDFPLIKVRTQSIEKWELFVETGRPLEIQSWLSLCCCSVLWCDLSPLRHSHLHLTLVFPPTPAWAWYLLPLVPYSSLFTDKDLLCQVPTMTLDPPCHFPGHVTASVSPNRKHCLWGMPWIRVQHFLFSSCQEDKGRKDRQMW